MSTKKTARGDVLVALVAIEARWGMSITCHVMVASRSSRPICVSHNSWWCQFAIRPYKLGSISLPQLSRWAVVAVPVAGTSRTVHAGQELAEAGAVLRDALLRDALIDLPVVRRSHGYMEREEGSGSRFASLFQNVLPRCRSP